jgi:hypothetical protein
MKKSIIVSVLILLVLFFMFNEKTENNNPSTETYPWQVSILADGRSSVFGIVLGETSLVEVNAILKSVPKLAVFEVNKKLSLEAYYETVSLGGLIGNFIFTLESQDDQLNEIKKKSRHIKRVNNNGIRYALDRVASEKLKRVKMKNLIYIPAAQLDEEIIVKRFGKPKHKIKLKTKEIGWHYLYPEKGLDLIYKEEGKEVLQYVSPKEFNLLLEPLQSH